MYSNTSHPMARPLISVLTVMLALTLATFAGQPANATTTEPSDDPEMFQGPDGLERGMAEAKGGLGIRFDLQPGDEIKISDNKQLATVIAADGT